MRDGRFGVQSLRAWMVALLLFAACDGRMQHIAVDPIVDGGEVAVGGGTTTRGGTLGAGGTSGGRLGFGGLPASDGGIGGTVGTAMASGGSHPGGTYAGGGTIGRATEMAKGGFGGFICGPAGLTFSGGQTLVDLDYCISCYCTYSGWYVCWGNDCAGCGFGGKVYAVGEAFSPAGGIGCFCDGDQRSTCEQLL